MKNRNKDHANSRPRHGAFPALLLLVLALACCRPAAAEDAAPPNILIILADDLGFSDLGCYGGEIPTPNLDKLAAEGIQFANFHSEAKCSPTRASLLSGLYRFRAGSGYVEKQLDQGNFTTLPRVLQTAGYRTGNFGKWHVSKHAGAHGFEEWVERTPGESHFSDKVNVNGETRSMESVRYGPVVYTDYAIDFIDRTVESGAPFFAFMAYYVPHFPLQAPEEGIRAYEPVYRELGWDRMREERYRRQVGSGLIPDGWRLSSRDPVVPAWETLEDGRKNAEARLMATYAAMVEVLDGQVGRLVDHLEGKGLLEDTFVLFFSDNGACPWVFNKKPISPPGPADSFRSYDSKWANACNTPFRLHKQWAHEGGVNSPAILHWPAGIAQPGRISRRVIHVIDVMPTLVELTGADYAGSHPGRKVLPMDGVSFLDEIDAPGRRGKPVFWEIFGGRAMRDGQWKLVGERSGPMELYDMEADGTETHNLAEQFPERVESMRKSYDAWARDVGAIPDQRARKMPPSKHPRLFP